MRKILATVVLAIGLVLSGASISTAEAAHHRVPGKVCQKQYLHPHSHKAQQCRKQGWWIEATYDSFDGLWDYVVISPKGRVFQDTFGQYSNVR